MGKKKKKRREKSGALVVLFSDTHCGSTYGLCPPKVQLDQGGYYTLSRSQRWLWESWLDFTATAYDRARYLGVKRMVVIINGDVTEGNHHQTRAVIGGGNETTQIRIANRCLREILDPYDQAYDYRPEAYFVRGTPAHVGGQSKLEESVADDFRVLVRTPDRDGGDSDSTGPLTWYHLLLQIGPTRMDIAHHGRLGRLKWTKANALGKLSISAEIDGYRRYKRPPDLVFRSHLHQYADSGPTYPVRVVATPAWQLVTGYVHRIDPAALADVGGFYIHITKKGYDLEPRIYRPEAPAPEFLEV